MLLVKEELKVVAKETLICKCPYEYEKQLKEMLELLGLQDVKCNYDHYVGMYDDE